MKRETLEAAAPWIVAIMLLLVWQAICSLFNVSDFIFPSPYTITVSLIEYAGPIAGHAWQTFWTTMIGFAIGVAVGLSLGIAIGTSRFVYKGLYPLLVAFNAILKVAFVPILVVWFGIGVGPAVLTAFLISFFPITVNIATGLTYYDLQAPAKNLYPVITPLRKV